MRNNPNCIYKTNYLFTYLLFSSYTRLYFFSVNTVYMYIVLLFKNYIYIVKFLIYKAEISQQSLQVSKLWTIKVSCKSEMIKQVSNDDLRITFSLCSHRTVPVSVIAQCALSQMIPVLCMKRLDWLPSQTRIIMSSPQLFIISWN